MWTHTNLESKQRMNYKGCGEEGAVGPELSGLCLLSGEPSQVIGAQEEKDLNSHHGGYVQRGDITVQLFRAAGAQHVLVGCKPKCFFFF